MATRAERRQLNHRWLRKWLTGTPHFVIGGEDNPYLLRWFVIPRNSFVNCYLHKFLRSDDDRALHDHPWPFLSWVLRGEYIEHTQTKTALRTRWSLAYRPAATAHRVQLLRNERTGREQPVWTLIVTGRNGRPWGFYCPRGWVHWEKFDSQNGCGEYA